MDAQMKRGLLEVCVLAALVRHDSYGYRIIKDLSPCIAVSESTLYPILKRLESSQCLSEYSQEHNGRLRKFYHLTENGRQRIAAFLGEWQDVMEVYRFIEEEWNHD
ncbi:MAG: PadR family transcriptional regulator [Firmicutes bacterium]|nr:PadR family transcriptional regulator [Bacillota bacterium]